MKRFFWVVLISGVLIPALAAARSAPTTLGSYKAWTANSYSDKGDKVCYMVSRPSASLPKNVRRGDIFVMVTRKAGSKASVEISFVSGYPFKKGTTAEVKVGSLRHDLITSEEYAWVADKSAAKRLLKAMIAGSEMTIHGLSSRGTKTTDTFSLLGFSAAHKAIKQGCK
jgi:invasion protein IalB